MEKKKLNISDVATLPPIAKQYSRNIMVQVNDREAVDGASGMAQETQLSTIKTASTTWKVHVSNMETFMVNT